MLLIEQGVQTVVCLARSSVEVNHRGSAECEHGDLGCWRSCLGMCVSKCILRLQKTRGFCDDDV
jgi:hypothetical protein